MLKGTCGGYTRVDLLNETSAMVRLIGGYVYFEARSPSPFYRHHFRYTLFEIRMLHTDGGWLSRRCVPRIIIRTNFSSKRITSTPSPFVPCAAENDRNGRGHDERVLLRRPQQSTQFFPYFFSPPAFPTALPVIKIIVSM